MEGGCPRELYVAAECGAWGRLQTTPAPVGSTGSAQFEQGLTWELGPTQHEIPLLKVVVYGSGDGSGDGGRGDLLGAGSLHLEAGAGGSARHDVAVQVVNHLGVHAGVVHCTVCFAHAPPAGG